MVIPKNPELGYSLPTWTQKSPATRSFFHNLTKKKYMHRDRKISPVFALIILSQAKQAINIINYLFRGSIPSTGFPRNMCGIKFDLLYPKN